MRLPRPVYAALYRYGLQPGQQISKRLLRPYLPRDAVILEAGAHKGTDTLQFSYMWPDGHVHAFEPVPGPLEILRANAASRRNITVYPLALGAAESRQDLWVSTTGHDGASSLREPTGHQERIPGIQYGEQLTVPVTTIEQWAAEHDVERVDAMWLDMQGVELDVLKAAGPVLDTTRALVLEISYVELFDGQALWTEVHEWLSERGFRLVVKTDERPEFGNAFLVRD